MLLFHLTAIFNPIIILTFTISLAFYYPYCSLFYSTYSYSSSSFYFSSEVSNNPYVISLFYPILIALLELSAEAKVRYRRATIQKINPMQVEIAITAVLSINLLQFSSGQDARASQT